MPLETSTSPGADPRMPHEGQNSEQSSQKDKSPIEPANEEEAIGEQVGSWNSNDNPGHQPVPQPPEKDPNLVEFDGPDDPGNPKNFAVGRKIGITVSMGLMVRDMNDMVKL